MAYTKNIWTDGDIVTSEKLNRMEDGIVNSESVFIVGGVSSEDGIPEGTLDKTWQEIHDAIQSKIGIIVVTWGGSIRQDIINWAEVDADSNYYINAGGDVYSTTTANGYPTKEAAGEGKV